MFCAPIPQNLSNNMKIGRKRVLILYFTIFLTAYEGIVACQNLRYGRTKMRYHRTTSTEVMIKPRKINGLKKLFVLSKPHVSVEKYKATNSLYVQIN